MFLSAGNITATIRVGVLFIDFEAPRRLRLEGDAELIDDPSPLADPGAQLAVRMHVRRVYPNCPRYIPKYKLIEPSPYLPRAGEAPLTPEWKRADWARDVLPAADMARGEDD
jgi:hypothetical protein